ncbi:MAG: mechanosensitive ion channel family protein [Candidatus Micrarchaeia archaeon]
MADAGIISIGNFDPSRLLPFIFAAIVAYSLAKALNYSIKILAKRIAGKTKTILDDLILNAIDNPLTIGLTGLSIYIAAVFSGIDGLPVFQFVSREFLILLAAYTLYNLFCATLRWYVAEVAPKRNPGIAEMETTIRRIAGIFIVSAAIIMILTAAGIEVSPLLASFGIAGLAVALAFQDTLGNFFAGIYISLDRPIKDGDYIQLETGQEGYVEKIGWRSAKIRLITNNTVIVPNSKLASSILTNFYAPDKTLTILIPCSVSYATDLKKAKKVAIEAMKRLQKADKAIDKKTEPIVWFEQFADSGVTFKAWLAITEYYEKYRVTSEAIIAIHEAFRKNGIEIPYPKRDVYIRQAPGGAALPRQGWHLSESKGAKP